MQPAQRRRAARCLRLDFCRGIAPSAAPRRAAHYTDAAAGVAGIRAKLIQFAATSLRRRFFHILQFARHEFFADMVCLGLWTQWLTWR